MSFIKWLSLCLLALLVLLAGWIYVGSIDADSFDDRGLLAELTPVPDVDNGYLLIAYLGGDDFSFKDIDKRYSLRDLASGQAWSQAAAENTLAANREVIEDIYRANRKSGFSTPYVHGDPMKIPNYSKLIDANRLLIIQSRAYVQSMEFDRAMLSVREALLFSWRVKSDESGYLISFMIGSAMQDAVVAWIHEMVSGYQLSLLQYHEIILLLEEIPGYQNDKFKNVFASEFRFGKDMMENMQKKSIKERLGFFAVMREFTEEDDDSYSFRELAYVFMTSILPEFYLHPKRIMEKRAVSMADMALLANKYCHAITVIEKDDADYSYYFSNPSWSDFFTPNSLSGKWADEEGHYGGYFAMRCLSHVYRDAVKTAVAVKDYQIQHEGRFPEKLEELVPHYLDRLPIDYFDGQPLRYSREQQWLYSVGADGKDDGGSVEGFYQGRCMKEDSCYNNPTVPLFLEPREPKPAEKKEACEQ